MPPRVQSHPGWLPSPLTLSCRLFRGPGPPLWWLLGLVRSLVGLLYLFCIIPLIGKCISMIYAFVPAKHTFTKTSGNVSIKVLFLCFSVLILLVL